MFTIIFPVLNERLRLENGVTRTVEYLQSIAFEDYEIIIVDNGSEDETPQIAEKLCKKYDKVSDMDAYPPYNSFIFVNKRSHEVHLSGYKPTSVADESLRGTGSDLSQDSNGIPMYYIAEDNMPFAINISNSEFRWPSEKVSITTYYPEFKQWRDSFGADYKDWYLHPKE